MINVIQSNFQASHDKRDLSFKDPKFFTLEEHFSNLNVHDQTFDFDDVGLHFYSSSPTLSNCSIPCDFFYPPSSSMVIFINMVLLHEFDHFFHPLDDDSMTIVESTDFSTSSSSSL